MNLLGTAQWGGGAAAGVGFSYHSTLGTPNRPHPTVSQAAPSLPFQTPSFPAPQRSDLGGPAAGFASLFLCSYGPSSWTPSDLGSWNGPEVVFQSNHFTVWPPAPSSAASQKAPSSSSSSSSSFCSSLCLAYLRPLALRPPPESSPSTEEEEEDSPENSSDLLPASPSATELGPSAVPRKGADPAPCPDVSNSPGANEKAESTALDLLPDTPRHLGAEMLPALLEGAGPRALASFAQINILQGYQQEDQVVLVAKSLAIRLGRGSAERAQSALPPPLPPPAQEGAEEEEPPELSFMQDKSLRLIDDSIRQKNLQAHALQSLQDSVRHSILRAGARASADAPLARLLPPPDAQDGVGEDGRQRLELHVQKKMVQRRFGLPSVVTASVRLFQALTSPFPGEQSAGSRRHAPKPEPALVPRDARQSRARLSLPSALGAPPAQPPGGRRCPISASLPPEEARQLAFHTVVKALEVQLGAFPALVEQSSRLLESLSAGSLPKPILLGSKTERLKPPSLPFLTQEALSIVDLNVSHKCLLSARTLSAQDLQAAVRTACQEPPACNGGSVQRVPSTTPGPPRGAEPPPALGELPGDSPPPPPPPEAPATPPSPSKPQGPEDRPTEGGPAELCSSPSPYLPEAPVPEPGQAARPTSTALVAVPQAMGAPCPFLLPPLAWGEDPGPFPSTLVLPPPSGSAEPRGPEDEVPVAVLQKLGAPWPVRVPTKAAPRREEDAGKAAAQKPGPPRQVQFQDATIPGLALDFCSWVTPGTPCPSLSSLVTSTTSCSSEAEAGVAASWSPDVPQQGPVQEAPIPGAEGPLSAPGPRDSPPSGPPRASRSSSSMLLSTTVPSSSALGRPEEAATKDRSQEPQEGRVQQATPSELGPGLEGRPPGPGALKSSGSLPVTAKALRPVPPTLFAAPPPSSPFPRGSEEDAAKKPCVSQEAALPRAAYPEPRPRDKAACPGAGTSVEGGAKADGKRTEAETGAGPAGRGAPAAPWAEGDGNGRAESKGWQEEEDRPVTHTSILLELELKKEKLNLHLKKRLGAPLLPQQRAALELSVDVDRPPGSRKAKRAAPQPPPPGPEAQGKPSRPFCYVCMPLDDSGSGVKTVCWDLPRWILDLNGHRVPQVARFEKRSKGSHAQ